MDSTPESRSSLFGVRRVWVALLTSAVILTVASLLVRTFPNSGNQAGYEAVMDNGEERVRSAVEAAAGTALPLCEGLYAESEDTPSEPRYEYESFIKGCGKAVDELHGRHVPLLPAN